MNSFNKTNDFKVLVEIYESKYKFVINKCHKKWPKLKKSIEYRINKMVGEKIDFENHLFKVFDKSTKTFVVLDQMVYSYFRRLPEMHVLVINYENINCKPNDSELKMWKNTKSFSELIVSEMDLFIEETEEYLAKSVLKWVNESDIDWDNVSLEMITNGYEEFDQKLCEQEFQRLFYKYIDYLRKCETDSEPENERKAFKYLNDVYERLPKKFSKKIKKYKQKSEKQIHKNTVNCEENGSKSNKKSETN